MPNMLNYNPAQVMMGWSAKGPYMGYGNGPARNPIMGPATASGTPAQTTVQSPQPPQTSTLGPEAVRATGTGPFDAAYRQNLATYAGGMMQKPGGNLSFDPTGPASGFPSGQSLLEAALGGGAFQPSTPTPAQQSGAPLGWQDWLKRFRDQGSLLTGGGFRSQELQ